PGREEAEVDLRHPDAELHRHQRVGQFVDQDRQRERDDEGERRQIAPATQLRELLADDRGEADRDQHSPRKPGESHREPDLADTTEYPGTGRRRAGLLGGVLGISRFWHQANATWRTVTRCYTPTVKRATNPVDTSPVTVASWCTPSSS